MKNLDKVYYCVPNRNYHSIRVTKCRRNAITVVISNELHYILTKTGMRYGIDVKELNRDTNSVHELSIR